MLVCDIVGIHNWCCWGVSPRASRADFTDDIGFVCNPANWEPRVQLGPVKSINEKIWELQSHCSSGTLPILVIEVDGSPHFTTCYNRYSETICEEQSLVNGRTELRNSLLSIMSIQYHVVPTEVFWESKEKVYAAIEDILTLRMQRMKV